MKRTIFCTGADGFIGKNLVEELQRDGKNELVLWNKDVCEEIKIKNDFDIIYHLAANTDTRFPDDVEMLRNNIVGFLQVLKFSFSGKSKLIYASSASLYGNYQKTAYAESKIIGDKIVEPFLTRYPIIGLRFFNVFGKYESQKGKMASMITQWAEQIERGERPRAFVEERDTKRDHIYVKDVVKALRQASMLSSGIYDVGSGIPTSFDKVLHLVLEYLKSDKNPEYIENPYKATYQKNTKANLDWGFKPDYSIEEGIKDYLCNYS